MTIKVCFCCEKEFDPDFNSEERDKRDFCSPECLDDYFNMSDREFEKAKISYEKNLKRLKDS